jgi:hypothetical protein
LEAFEAAAVKGAARRDIIHVVTYLRLHGPLERQGLMGAWIAGLEKVRLSAVWRSQSCIISNRSITSVNPNAFNQPKQTSEWSNCNLPLIPHSLATADRWILLLPIIVMHPALLDLFFDDRRL